MRFAAHASKGARIPQPSGAGWSLQTAAARGRPLRRPLPRPAAPQPLVQRHIPLQAGVLQLDRLVLGCIEGALGLQQRQQAFSPCAVTHLGQRQRTARLLQLLGVRQDLRIHAGQRVQRRLHIAQGLDDGLPVDRQKLCLPGLGQLMARGQPASVEHRCDQPRSQRIQGVVEHAAQPVIAGAQAAGQCQARQHGRTGHRHIGMGGGQLRLGPRHVRAAKQQFRWQARIQRWGTQGHHAALHHGRSRCLSQQYLHGSLGQGHLLLQQGQAALLRCHQPALLRQVQRRRRTGAHPGVDELQQPLGAAQIGVRNLGAFAQGNALQPCTGHPCGHSQSHGITVIGAGAHAGLGALQCRPVPSPEIQLIAGRQRGAIAGPADGGLPTKPALPAGIYIGRHHRQQRSARLACTGCGLVHTGRCCGNVPAAVVGLRHQGIQLGTAQAAPPILVHGLQIPLRRLLPLGRQGRRPCGGLHRWCRAPH